MGYKAKFENGYTVEFDHPPTDQELEEAHSHVKGVEQDDLGQKSLGLLEAGANTVSGLVGTAAGGFAGIAAGLQGFDPSEASNAVAESLTYKPRTEKGQEYVKGLGDTFHKASEATGEMFANELSDLNKEKMKKGTLTAADLRAEAMQRTFGESLINAGVVPGTVPGMTEGIMRGKVKGKPGLDPNKLFDTTDPNAPNRNGRMQGELFEPRPNETPATPYNPGQAGVTEPINPFRSRAQMDLPFGQGVEPTIPVDAQGVARNGANPALEMAVQRQREVEAANGPMASTVEGIQNTQMLHPTEPVETQPRPGPSPTENMAMQLGQKSNQPLTAEEAFLQMRRAQKEQALAQADARRRAAQGGTQLSDEPINVDPSGQAFRGDVTDPLAQQALDKQKEAARNNLEHGIATSEGQPMDLLTRDSLRSANEGPQVDMQGTLNAGLKGDVISQAVDNHPLVQKAEQAVTKQEELLIKLAGDVKAGKKMPMSLVKAKKDLEGLERARDATRSNVESAVRTGQRATPFNFKNQGGGVLFDSQRDNTARNEKFTQLAAAQRGRPESLMLKAQEALQKEPYYPSANVLGQLLEHVGDLTHRMSESYAQAPGARFGREYVAEKVNRAIRYLTNPIDLERMSKIPDMPELKAYADAHRELPVYNRPQKLARDAAVAVGEKDFPKATENLQALKKLLDNGMYESAAGSFKGPGKSQRGALLIDPEDQNQGKFLSSQPHLKLPGIVPDKYTPEQVIRLGKEAPDVDQNFLQKAANVLTKGGLYQALKTDNVVVRFYNQTLLEADRLFRGDVERIIHAPDGFGSVTRAMNSAEKAQIWEAMSRADKMKMALSEDRLRAAGANDAQIAYWKTHGQVMDQAFDAINRARDVAGLGPVSRRAAYAAMRATGDFKRLVYKTVDGEKQVVGVIGSNFELLTKWRANELKKLGYEVDEKSRYNAAPKGMDSAQTALMHNIEILAKNDPRVGEFLDTLAQITSDEAYRFANMKKHTLAKKGIFGMEGRKLEEVPGQKYPWQKMAEVNAEEGMQSQLMYAESALKWARLSEAVDQLKQLTGDAELQSKQRNALEWGEKYMQNALGFNPEGIGQGLEKALASFGEMTGFGSSAMRHVTSVARKGVNTLLLALDPIFWVTNLIQPMRTLPGIRAYLTTKGLDASMMDLGTGYSYLVKAGLLEWRAGMGQALTPIEAGAYAYARSHHVYGSDLVEHSNRASKDFGFWADKVGNFGASHVEASTRRAMFFAITHLLHENGLSVKNGLYEAAHNVTDMAMNNYSSLERPRLYNMMGPVGQTSANLMSYKHNEVSRLMLLGRQLAEEKSAKPLLTELTAMVAFGGILGVTGFQTADEIYKAFTKYVLKKPDSLTLRAIQLSENIGNAMGAAKDSGARYLTSHGMFSLLGIDMSRRLGIGNVVSDSTVDFAAPGFSKAGEVAVAGKNAAFHPSEMNTKRFVREISPRPVASNMDLEWFSKNNYGAHNRNNLDYTVPRTPGDVLAKRLGMTGIHESVARDKNFDLKQIEQGETEIRSGVVSRARDELFAHNKVSDETLQDYIKGKGDPNSFVSDVSRLMKKQNVPERTRVLMEQAASRSVTNYLNLKRRTEVYNR